MSTPHDRIVRAESPPKATENRPADDRVRRGKPKLGWPALWFGVTGGIAGWAIQLLVAWSVMEVSCLAPLGFDDAVLNQAYNSLEARLAAYCATALGLLLAIAALIVTIRNFRLLRRLDVDLLASGRTHLLLVFGAFLNSFAIAAMSGGAIALGVLPACA